MRRAAMSMVSIQARTKGTRMGSAPGGLPGEFDGEQGGGVFEAGAAVGGGGEFYVA